MVSLGEPSGYSLDYHALIGERKTGESALEDRKRLVKDPQAMTLMGLGVAMGFAPYAGYGWAMYEVLSKDYGGPVLVGAAQKLANDPDPLTEKALVKGASNKNWKVRVAATGALASRDDAHVLDAVVPHMSGKKQASSLGIRWGSS